MVRDVGRAAAQRTPHGAGPAIQPLHLLANAETVAPPLAPPPQRALRATLRAAPCRADTADPFRAISGGAGSKPSEESERPCPPVSGRSAAPQAGALAAGPDGIVMLVYNVDGSEIAFIKRIIASRCRATNRAGTEAGHCA